MRKGWQLILILAAIYIMPGCGVSLRKQAYYTSPLNGFSNNYQPLPQVRDSAHTAVYAHAGVSGGNANTEHYDGVTAFRGSFTVAHHGKWWQAYYGADLTLGNYRIGKRDSGHTNIGAPYPMTPMYNTAILNSLAGPKFFGAGGFHGGANIVIPFRDGELRILGVETSLNNEFGQYLSVRRHMADTAATLIARNSFYGSWGFGSELIGSTLHGEFGFRISGGQVVGYPYSNPGFFDNESGHFLHYWYVAMSSHYTYGRYTGYAQFNFAAKALSFGMGLHYRLTRPRNAPVRPLHQRRIFYQH